MDKPAGPYQIRLARPDEVPRLRAIEDEAGMSFGGLGLIDEALDVSFPWTSWPAWSAKGRFGLAVWRTTCRWAW